MTVEIQPMAPQNLGRQMKTSLPNLASRTAMETLDEAYPSFARRYPGETGRRQPVHTVYGGAHLFQADTARRLGNLALATLGEYAPDAFGFARAVGLLGAEKLPRSASNAAALERQFAASPEKLRRANRAAWLAHAVYSRVLEKLQ